jgi:hypothetical protein
VTERPLLGSLIDALSVWAVFSIFSFFLMLSAAGTYYGVWETSGWPADDRPLVHKVSGSAQGVFEAAEAVVEEIRERITR